MTKYFTQNYYFKKVTPNQYILTPNQEYFTRNWCGTFGVPYLAKLFLKYIIAAISRFGIT